MITRVTWPALGGGRPLIHQCGLRLLVMCVLSSSLPLDDTEVLCLAVLGCQRGDVLVSGFAGVLPYDLLLVLSE